MTKMLSILFILGCLIFSYTHGVRAESTLQLVAIQMKCHISDYTSPEAFKAKIRALMEQIQRDRDLPALVVFPENTGTLLMLTGLGEESKNATSLEEAITLEVKRNHIPVLWNRLRYRVGWVRGFIFTRVDAIAKIYVETFSQMAKEYNVYIVAGSICLPEYDVIDGRLGNRSRKGSGNIYNTSYVFGPDGKIIGTQKKVHLIELEMSKGLELTSGDLYELEVFHTPIGKLAVGICLDSFKEDVISKLAEDGGQILLQPSANPGPWSLEQQEDWLNGSWKWTQGRGQFKYAVNPMMVGHIFDLIFEGQSSILTSEPFKGFGYMSLGEENGFLKVASSYDEEELLMVTVEL